MSDLKLSDTFCPFPWMHLHAWPTGKAMLCCIAHGGDNGGEVGDFSKNTFAEIINSDKLKDVRKQMLAGEKVEQCIACYNSETINNRSFRVDAIQTYEKDIDFLLSKTENDGYINDPVMYYMDFRFSNLCNLGCRTCGAQLSSTIAASMNDDNELRMLREKGVLSARETITSFVYARPDFMEIDVYPYIENVKGFYFAGGEPLMHHEHYDILTYLVNHKMFDKSIIYSTNLTTLTWKNVNFLDIWKDFNHLNFICSIDGYEEKLEYIRHRTKNDNVFDNLRKLIQFKKDNPSKYITVTICYTHSIYNAYYTREFFEYLDEQGLIDDLDNVILNYSFGDNNSISMLPDFAKEELKAKRKSDLDSASLQKAFKKFGCLEHDFKAVDEVIDATISYPFDKFVVGRRLSSGDINNALPWLGSVIERYQNQ